MRRPLIEESSESVDKQNLEGYNEKRYLRSMIISNVTKTANYQSIAQSIHSIAKQKAQFPYAFRIIKGSCFSQTFSFFNFSKQT